MIPFNEVVYAKAHLTRETTNLHLDAQKTLQNKKLLMPSFDQLVNVKLSVSFQWCLVKAMSPFLLVIKEQAYISENMCWRVLHKALDEKVLNCKMMLRKQDKKKPANVMEIKSHLRSIPQASAKPDTLWLPTSPFLLTKTCILRHVWGTALSSRARATAGKNEQGSWWYMYRWRKGDHLLRSHWFPPVVEVASWPR